MAQTRQELFFGVRWRQLARYLGQFSLVVGVLNLVVLVVAVMDGEMRIAGSYGVVVAFLLGIGGVLGRTRVRGRMQMNEALVLAAMVFLLVPCMAAIPLVLHGIPFLDAWFETVSAATTTGLSTLGPVEERPATFAFARAWMQWYGGLGIVVLSLALVVRPGMTALRLAKQETPDDLVGGTRAHARRVLVVYLAMTCCGLVVWVLLGGSPIEGLLYLLSAVSTGGFAPTSGSFADLPNIGLAFTVTLFTLGGALPLALYYKSWHDGWRQLLQNIELRILLFAGVFMSFLLAGNLWLQGMTVGEAAIHAPLMALSAQTTSGFSSLAPSNLDNGSKMILILAMATGGSVGSTAGGFKLLRVLVLFGLVFRCLKSVSVPPDAVVDQRLGGKKVEADEIQDALMIILMFAIVVSLSWLPFLMYGYAPMDALFEVVSATGTVGLSSGITGPSLPAALKMVLCADMLLGRLEFVAWLVFFYHRTWFARKRGNR